MTNSITEVSQRTAARVAGFMYLFTMATAVFAAFYVESRIIVYNDAAQTASNIIASERLFRIGIASELITWAGVVVLILALYVLLKPVNQHLALLAVFWRIVETSIFCVISLISLVVLLLLSGADYLKAFETNQLQALARLAISAHGAGYNVGLIFVGLGSTVFSYLLFKSRYVPRALAAWGVFSSLVLLTGALAIIVFPSWRATLTPGYFAPITIYEVTVGFWLLLKGARIQSSAPQAV